MKVAIYTLGCKVNQYETQAMEQELTRATVEPRYTWDVTRIYASDEAWEFCDGCQ